MSRTKAWLAYCQREEELLDAMENLEQGYSLDGQRSVSEIHIRTTWKTIALHCPLLTPRVMEVLVERPWLHDQLMMNEHLSPSQAHTLLNRTLQILQDIEERPAQELFSDIINSAPAEFSFTTLVQALEVYHKRFTEFPSAAHDKIVGWIKAMDGSKEWTVSNIRGHLLDVMVGTEMTTFSTKQLISFFHARRGGGDIHLVRLMTYASASQEFFEYVLRHSSLTSPVLEEIAQRPEPWQHPPARRHMVQQILERPTATCCRALLLHTTTAEGFQKRFQAFADRYPVDALQCVEQRPEKMKEYLTVQDMSVLLFKAPRELRPKVVRFIAQLS